MNTLAASFTVDGVHGVLLFLAVLLFLGAAFAFAFGPAPSPEYSRAHRLAWVLVAAGLCLATLSFLVSG
jgi:hypothetical protein